MAENNGLVTVNPKVVTVRLSGNEYDKLTRLAKLMNTTRGAFIREMLRQAESAVPGTVVLSRSSADTPETGAK